MGLSILGGILRGHSLIVPKGDVIRPTSILLRRRIFDSKQDLSGHIFIDCCAGSGAVGVEAWSRGADAVYFSEPVKNVFRVLQDNLTQITKKMPDEVRERPLYCKNISAERWMDEFKTQYLSWSEEKQKNTIFFLDPPYEIFSIYQEILLKGLAGQWFIGELWLESDRQKGKPSSFWPELGVEEIKLFSQGTSYVLKGKIC